MHDEFEKIDWLKARYELDVVPERTLIGIGDDAAVLDLGDRPTVLTVDAQIEGVHFRQDLLSPEDIGWRAVVAAASDILAMGAIPSAALSALTLPNGYANDDFQSLVEGLALGAEATFARIVGGNLSRASVLTLTTTVVGAPIGEAIGRAGARIGDALYVTGTLGASALGFRMLDSGLDGGKDAEPFVSRWRRPPSRRGIVDAVAHVATACIDVSDGCLQDLGHLCAASNVGAEIQAGALPLDDGFEAACAAVGEDPVELALAGGEDYELLFTAPRSKEADAVATAIGTITAGGDISVIGADGRRLEIATAGFRHFS
jgi:thiamine-monophosphate kinase